MGRERLRLMMRTGRLTRGIDVREPPWPRSPRRPRPLRLRSEPLVAGRAMEGERERRRDEPAPFPRRDLGAELREERADAHEAAPLIPLQILPLEPDQPDQLLHRERARLPGCLDRRHIPRL